MEVNFDFHRVSGSEKNDFQLFRVTAIAVTHQTEEPMTRGNLIRENRRIHTNQCWGCGISFQCAHPLARTHNNRCRSALRRFRKLYGCEPTQPLNDCNIYPSYWQRNEWYKVYLPVGHKLNPAPEPEPVPVSPPVPKKKPKPKPKAKTKTRTAKGR